MEADGVDDDDPVVRELDVYVCNEFAGSHTQLCLFQLPLRPPWRPYDYSKDLSRVKHIKMKPVAKRVEIEVPLPSKTHNYNNEIEDFKKIHSFKLRSTLVEAKTTWSVGTIMDGKLLLAPVDFALQLRPSLAHLNVGNMQPKKKEGEESEEEEEDEPKMRAVEVQVQKRETERQQQARLNSYAYIAQKEEEEPWSSLALHSDESPAAQSVWDRFMASTDKDIQGYLDRQTYLRCFMPSLSTIGPAAAGSGGAPGPGLDPGGASQEHGALAPSSAPPAAPQEHMPPEVTKALPAALMALFQRSSVCNMGNIRSYLARYCHPMTNVLPPMTNVLPPHD